MANKNNVNNEAVKTAVVDNKKKSLIIKITAIVLAVLFFLTCVAVIINSQAPANPKDYHVFCLSGFKGSFNKKGNPNSYWGVEKLKSGNDYFTVYGQVQTLGAYTNVSEIWMNVSDLYEDETDIEIVNQSSRVIKKFNLTAKNLKKSKDGWFKVYDLAEAKLDDSDNILAVNSSTFSFGIATKLNVREVVFVGKDGKLIDYNVKGIKISNQELDVEHKDVKDNPNSVLNIKNEQKTFPYAKN